MASAAPTLKDSAGSAPGGQAATGGATVNAPDVDVKTLRANVRAISSVEQIYAICGSMFDPDSERNKMNGIIAEKYNDGPPFNPKELEESGETFRHNFPTGFMSGIINQVVAAPVDAIDQGQYLTSAALNEEDDPGGVKTEAFRREFTKLVRSWSGWRTHIYNDSQEVCTFGYGAVVCIDPDDWRPQEYRQDEFGVPDGTGQHADDVQFFGLRKSFQIDKILNLIKDRDSAEAAGWEIENVVEAVNESMPGDRTTKGDGAQGASSRSYVDLMREGNSGAAADPKTRTVDVYILLAKEADGKISKFMVSQRGTRKLYENFDEYENMRDILTLYSLEPGNGKLYGSKGLGRKLINLHLAIERARNRAADQIYLSSMIWMRSPKGVATVQFKVRHPFGVIGSEAEIQSDALPANIEPFIALDERLSAFAEQSAGAYIPRKLGTDTKERTAHEAVIEAQRENLTRQSYLKRLLGQFADEVMMIKKRACMKDTSDKEAKEFQQMMEKEHGISAELLKKLAEQPEGGVVPDLTAAHAEALIKAGPLIMASPHFDKFNYEREVAIRTLGLELTTRLMFPNGIDPRNEAAQINKQILETTAIRSGESVPVVPDDNHKIHSKWIIGDLERGQPVIDAQVQDGSIPPQVLDNVQTIIKHGEEHVKQGTEQAQIQGNQDDAAEFQKHAQFYVGAQQKLDEALKFLVQKKQQQAQQPQQPAPGQPGAAAPPVAATPMPQFGSQEHVVKLSETIPYDKSPPQIQRQLEALFGMKPAYGASAENDWGGPTGGAPEEQTAPVAAAA